jgi:hypothetical protein
MDRVEREEECRMLESIAVMLLRLAVLAELLCVLPLPLRLLLLPPLRLAEAIARAFALEQAGGALALPPAAVPGAHGDGRAEALRLARCLRALAVALGGLQAFAGRRLRGGTPDRRFARCAPSPRGSRAMVACRAERMDTS